MMKNNKTLVVKDYYDDMAMDFKSIFSFNSSLKGLTLNIRVDSIDTLEKILSNQEFIMKELRKFENYAYNNLQIYGIWNYYYENADKLWDSISYIQLDLEKLAIHDFIEKNKILKTKKIIIRERFRMTDYESLKELEKEYEGVKDNLYISLLDSHKLVTIDECYRKIKYIKDTQEHIKKLDFSPLEQLMYLYDSVKSKLYREYEVDKDNLDKSLELIHGTYKDDVVQQDFLDLYSSIMLNLGFDYINPITMIKEDKNEEHKLLVINLKDEKYGIDGAYFIDPSIDLKGIEKTYYLDDYTGFVKTLSYIKDFYSCDNKIKFKEFSDSPKELVDSLKRINDMSYNEKTNLTVNMINLFRIVSNSPFKYKWAVIYSIDLYEEKEELEKIIYETYDNFNREIPDSVISEVLKNVRRVHDFENEKQEELKRTLTRENIH